MAQNNTQTSETCTTQLMSTSSAEDFPAKTSVQQDEEQVLKEKDLDFGQSTGVLFGRLDLSTSSLKTAQLSLFEGGRKSYATFPKSGICVNGDVYVLTNLEPITKEKDSMRLPTHVQWITRTFIET